MQLKGTHLHRLIVSHHLLHHNADFLHIRLRTGTSRHDPGVQAGCFNRRLSLQTHEHQFSGVPTDRRRKEAPHTLSCGGVRRKGRINYLLCLVLSPARLPFSPLFHLVVRSVLLLFLHRSHQLTVSFQRASRASEPAYPQSIFSFWTSGGEVDSRVTW